MFKLCTVVVLPVTRLYPLHHSVYPSKYTYGSTIRNRSNPVNLQSQCSHVGVRSRFSMVVQSWCWIRYASFALMIANSSRGVSPWHLMSIARPNLCCDHLAPVRVLKVRKPLSRNFPPLAQLLIVNGFPAVSLSHCANMMMR